MNTVRSLVLAGAAATALGLTACSSGGSGTPPAPSRAGSSAAGRSSASQPATPTSGANAAAPGAGNASGFCTQLGDASQAIQAVGGTSTMPSSAYVAKLRAVVAAAPAEIKSDLQTIEQIDEQIVAGHTAAESSLATPAVLATLRHFLAWMQTNCPGVLDIPSGLPTS